VIPAPDCEITEDGVSLRFFFFPKTIPFQKIKSVRKVSLWNALLESLHPFKKPFYSNGGIRSHCVILETERLRYAVHPKNADDFVRVISNRLAVPNQGSA
jgi:hypothetical protein